MAGSGIRTWRIESSKMSRFLLPEGWMGSMGAVGYGFHDRSAKGVLASCGSLGVGSCCSREETMIQVILIRVYTRQVQLEGSSR